ncbi:MAG TPA: CinA family protein [Burkholderiales bacterium]|nr:CinA family protein [Burkholderiales bacterium]
MNELESMAASVGEALKARSETVMVAESSCGGLISAALLAVPGASVYYRGGLVLYTYESRRKFLARDGKDPFEGVTPSSEAYAAALARAVRATLNPTWAIGETGAAGPTGSRYGHGPGHACIAVDGPLARAVTIETRQSDRETNMRVFTRAALDLLAAALREAPRA